MWPLPRASDMTAPAARGEAIATEEVAMTYSAGAVERAMTVHQAVLHALHGRQTGLQVADVIGLSPRSVRRWRARLEQFGVPGLLDRRRRTPSPRRVPLAELQRVLRLYRERYQGFNVRHFHQLARRDYGVTFSYTLVKTALPGAGLVAKGRARGRHRRRREPRPCVGDLLHLDGSRHRWLALVPDAWHTLLVVVDDATKQLLYAQLVEGGESTRAIMQALWTVFTHHGLPGALYTDRAHWASWGSSRCWRGTSPGWVAAGSTRALRQRDKTHEMVGRRRNALRTQRLSLIRSPRGPRGRWSGAFSGP
jgi:transposase